jgi:hypothetical protein
VTDHEDDFYDGPWGQTYRFEDNLGPDMLHGISRYPDYPDGTDFSEAVIDPLSEAIGRYVRVCAQLEIAIYRARAQLDPDPAMTFAVAEHRHKTDKCIKALRGIADDLHLKSRWQLLELLDQAERWLQLRHGVVHGVYRKNHRIDMHEGRRFKLNPETRQYELVREPYNRDTLMLAVTRASNTASDILAGLDEWKRQLRRRRSQ